MKIFRNRTVIGVLCILLALIICFGVTPLFSRSASEKTEIVRVTKDIKEGDEITAEMVQTVEVGAYNLPQNLMTDKKEVVGKYATADLAAGDYILSSKLSAVPAAENAYLYNLDGKKQAISVTIKSFATGLSGKLESLGLLPKEDALRLGVVGPVARGSGIAIDVRKDSPYAAYPDLEFKSITHDGCCIHSRTMVRLDEIFESFKLIRQCCERMPEGPHCVPMRQIHTAEACARSEAPRGEVFYYIRTNGTDIPARLKWRVPSYMNWEALGVMMRDCAVADVALITNSIDPCVSCTER